jgi:hypothetical protein
MSSVYRPLGLAGLVLLAVGLSTTAQADDFMPVCLQTSTERMCQCVSPRIAPEMRADAIAGLRKSNAAMAPGSMPIDPGNMSPNEMKGLNAVIAAQAYCM